MKIADNTAAAVKRYFHDQLKGIHSGREIESIFYLCLEHFFNLTRKDLIMNPNHKFSESDLLKFIFTVKELKKHRPIQYIFGECEFYNLKLKVNENVLIPRPETEELVQWVIDICKRDEPKLIADLCTGSGCIALALKAHWKEAKVYGYDVSAPALELANENAKNLGLDVQFTYEDVLDEFVILPSNLDVMVSNPPYVLKKEIELMKKHVLDNEPHIALFVENDNPLQFHARIADLGNAALKKGGLLFYEINERYGEQLKSLLEEKGYVEVEIKQDLSSKNRFVKGRIKE